MIMRKHINYNKETKDILLNKDQLKLLIMINKILKI